jgi:hypothetical protein
MLTGPAAQCFAQMTFSATTGAEGRTFGLPGNSPIEFLENRS